MQPSDFLLEIRDVGLVDYADGLRAQELLADAVREARVASQLLLLNHPPVVTLGRQGLQDALRVTPEELAAREIELFQVDRGGNATFHDPGQLVGYPLLQLSRLPSAMSQPAGLVTTVEEILRVTLASYGVEARRVAGRPGLWLGERKIAALGLRLDRGVSRHGFALNVATAPTAWQVIVPCGLHGLGVTSLFEQLGRVPAHHELIERLSEATATVLNCPVLRRPPEELAVQVLVARTEPPEFLLLQRTVARGGFWQPVTGMVEPNETPRAAAARELQEETGVVAESLIDLQYVHAFVREVGVRPGYTGAQPTFVQEHTYLAVVPRSTEPRLDPREHVAWCWASVEEALHRLVWPGNRRALRLALADITRSVAEPRGKT